MNGFTQVLSSLIECSDNAKDNDLQGTHNGFPTCRESTDILPVIIGTGKDADSDPVLNDAQFAVFEPVYPANNVTKMVGVCSTVVSFSDLLRLAVPDYMDGIDVVFSSETVKYT